MSKKKFLPLFLIGLLVSIICLSSLVNTKSIIVTAVDEGFYVEDVPNDLHMATRISDMTNQSPVITVLTAGLAAHAGNWSNSLNSNEDKTDQLRYTHDSIIERLRDKANSALVLLCTYLNDNHIKAEILVQPDKEFDVYKSTQVSKLTANHMSNNEHIILVADLSQEGAVASHDEAYKELHTIIDKVSFNVFTLTRQIPRINLIGHSRGGILNLKYAIDHAYNVDQMFSIGTPYIGTNLGEIGVQMSKKYPTLFEDGSFLNQALFLINSQGGEDCANLNIANQLREQWRTNVENTSANINVHAIGGITDLNFLISGLDKDDWTYTLAKVLVASINSPMTLSWVKLLLACVAFDLDNSIARLVQKYVHEDWVGWTELFKRAIVDWLFPELKFDYVEGIFPFDLVLTDDILIDYDSQTGQAGSDSYNFTKYKLFYTQNTNILKLSSNSPVPVPHLLESRDDRFINIVLNNITMGNTEAGDFGTVFNQDGTLEIIGINTIQESIEIPSQINGINITSIAANAFEGDKYSAISNMVLPDTIKTIGENAFLGCTGLTNIILKSSPELINGNVFAACTKLQTITINTAGKYYTVNGVLFDAIKSDLLIYPAGKTDESYTIPDLINEIDDNAFLKNSYIQEVVLPPSLKNIKQYAFYNCSSLEEVTGGEGVEWIGLKAFYNTPWWNKPQSAVTDYLVLGKTLVKYIGSGNEVIKFPFGISVIGANAFTNDIVTKVILPNEITTLCDYAFEDCTNLTSITMSSEMSQMGSSIFARCAKLSEVYMMPIVAPVSSYLPFGGLMPDLKIFIPALSKPSYESLPHWEFYKINLFYKPTQVRFDSNGGTVCESKTVDYYSVLTDMPVPTREGYRFTGWYYTDEENKKIEVNKDKQYQNGSVWDKFDGGTLIADWTPINYAIHYELNSGTNHKDNPTQYNIEQSITLNAPTRENYVFQGWYLDEAFTHETTGFPIGEINEKTFYAKWLGEERVLTYFINGITREATINYGNSFKLDVPTEPGRYFTGWVWNNQRITDENGNSELTMIPENVVLTPSWEYSFILKIQGNNGSLYLSRDGLSETETSITPGKDLIVNGEYRCPHCLAAAFLQTEYGKKIGHYFTCFRDSNGSELSCWKETNIYNTYQDNSEVVITADFDPEEYEIYLNGGTYGYWSKRYKYGEDLDVYASLSTIAIRPGYHIAYWKITRYNSITDPEELQRIFKELSCRINFEKVPDLSPGVAEKFSSIEATPEWENNEYTMTLVYDTGAKDYRRVIFDKSFTLPSYSRLGYSFIGWFDEQGQPVNSGTWTWPSDKTFTVKTSLNEYTITYIANGIEGSNPNTTTYTIESSFTLLPVEKIGYVFRSWKLGNEDILQIEPGRTEDITLTADWIGKVYTNLVGNVELQKDSSNNGVVIIDLSNRDRTQKVSILIKKSIDSVTLEGGYVGPVASVTVEKRDSDLNLIFNDCTLYAPQGHNAITLNMCGATTHIKIYGHSSIMGGTGYDADVTYNYDGLNAIEAYMPISFDGGTGELYLYGGTGGKGRTGSTGAKGTAGGWGDSFHSSGYEGGQGGLGGKGGKGGSGGYAIWSNTSVQIVSYLNSMIYLNGGRAGRGGTGGKGGQGGDGGPAGDGAFLYPAGNGGKGGKGGTGGAGGEAGNKGKPYRIGNNAQLNCIQYVGEAGMIGRGGDGGTGGTGGRGGKVWNRPEYRPAGAGGEGGDGGSGYPSGSKGSTGASGTNPG